MPQFVLWRMFLVCLKRMHVLVFWMQYHGHLSQVLLVYFVSFSISAVLLILWKICVSGVLKSPIVVFPSISPLCLLVLFYVFGCTCIRTRQSTPLQYSCLENPMGRGVHGVAKSQKRLSDFIFTFLFHALEKEMATHSSVLAWRIPGTAEPGGLPSLGSYRVGHD